MFTNVEGKLKSWAKICCICGVIAAIGVMLFAMAVDEDLMIPAIAVACFVILISFIQACFIYAFAELIENTKEIRHILQITNKEIIAEDIERRKQIEQEQAEKKPEESYTAVQHYWDKTPEEEATENRKQSLSGQGSDR